MALKVKVREYLDELKDGQEKLPPLKRKPVPTVAALAQTAGVKRQSMHRFVSRGNHKEVNLSMLNAIITCCRRYGFNTQVADVLEYLED